MADKELIALFGNGRRDNIIFKLNAGETVTCHFKASGINSTTNKFYNLKHSAKKVGITVSAVASITKINNQTLTSPRTLGTGAMNRFSEGIEWNTIIVRADTDNTIFEIYAS